MKIDGQYIKAIGTILGLILIGVPTAIAQTAETTDANAQIQSEVMVFPHEKTFIITAYYSPIEGQERYIRGTLAADKKLNGNGTHGADGTPVYPGMIAAPKNIPFGTKMLIPGIGTVAVHDRGGAIVPAGQRGHQYDRLDVWMGYGDEGLNRALRWGRRTVTVVVYGQDDEITENIDLSGVSASTIISTSSSSQINSEINTSFGYGDQDAQISDIKNKLADLKYFNGQIDETYDEDLYKAVLKFQLQNEIIDSENEFGAGYFGPQTRRTLGQAYQSRETYHLTTTIPKAKAENKTDSYSENVLLAGNGLSFLSLDLKPGDSGQAVIELQTELNKLHLFGLEPTGYYGEVTEHAVYKFQQSQQLVGDKTSLGAGVLGPQTRAKLSALVNSRIDTRKLVAKPEESNLLAQK